MLGGPHRSSGDLNKQKPCWGKRDGWCGKKSSIDGTIRPDPRQPTSPKTLSVYALPAWSSILAPNYKIKPHRGITKGVLRSHPGLIAPQKWQHCRIVVGGQPVHWQEGKCFVFDDSMLYRATNGTNEERAILLFDFDRPMRWPSSALNRLTISLMKRTAYYRDARRNLKKHARAKLTEADRDQAIADAMQRVAD
jgi:ornithine lipid ester-linked acyl 2-hydroxylase